MTCKDCVHIDVCYAVKTAGERQGNADSCKSFKNKAGYAEVKHGEWSLHPDGSGTCNLCGRTQKSVWDFDNVQTYCGKCGAKMDGGDNDDSIEWININDRLPTDNDMLISSVLIYTEDGGVAEAGYDIKNNRFLQYRWSDPNPEVLYWMPLPKPPKGASNETD